MSGLSDLIKTDQHNELRLHACDLDDLDVVSALVQDAAVFVAELAYIPRQKRFGAALARFAWEHADSAPPPKGGMLKRLFGPKPNAPYERTRALLHIDNVLSVKARGFGLDEKARVLDLLAITATPQGDDPSGPFVLQLTCADGAALRLEVETIDVFLTDKGERWTTPIRPSHETD